MPRIRCHLRSHDLVEWPSTFPERRAGTRAAANGIEIACTPTSSSWLYRIEARFTVLRYATLDHAGHKEQGSMIRRCIIWRNRRADDRRLRVLVDRATVA